MAIGIFFILAGLMLVIYPPLLSLIVASVLIFTGIGFVVVSYNYKKTQRRADDPFMNFFMRF